jgi:hypothetical protein
MLAFFAILLVLLAIYYFVDTNDEGFESMPVSYKINMPENVVKRSDAPGEVKPSVIPGSLPTGPYEQIARNNPVPFQEPALQRTNRARILKALDNVKGFLAFEAQEIEDKSDPAIQLPLATARGDFTRLESEARVLQRNPGLQPEMTELQIAEIEDNLAYLQRKVRLIGMNRPFGDYQWDKIAAAGPTKKLEGFANPTQETPSESSDPATIDELTRFSTRILTEMMRLRASGNTDPIIAARVGNLNEMKLQVDDVIKKVESGEILSSEIPIMQSDIDKALPILGQPTEPLPQILKSAGLPPELGNLLPSNITKDPNVTRQINDLVNKYAEDFFKGTSASVSFKVNYRSPRDIEYANAKAKAKVSSGVASSGFPTNDELTAASSSPAFMPSGSEVLPGSGLPSALPAPEGGIRPVFPSYNVAHFDWKQRAKEIEDQIRKRKLNPSDFGIMKRGTQVSPDFSWRGYAKSICTRLQATPDPDLPVACGCPPLDWRGWNI